MKISTEIGSIAKLVDEEKAVEFVARAGFDAWDFSMFQMCVYNWTTKKGCSTSHPLSIGNYLLFARRLKQIGLDNGIVCNQSHAPFPVDCPEIRSYLKRAIECTAEAGGEICVIHPANFKTPQENAEMYFELLEFAKQIGVKIATENMWGWDDVKNQADFAACATPESFIEQFNAVNYDEFLVACLDIGHAEMRGLNTSAVDMIKMLGNKLQALHVHDNDKWHDSHSIPFSMSIDFYPIMKALKECKYNGYLTLEADAHLNKFNVYNVFEGVMELAASANKLRDIFENI